MKQPHWYLGCPVWACDRWVGKLYSSTRRQQWLAEYSSVFSTVEGNSTFYGQPSDETVHRWASETNSGFRFALKFPRTITHEKQLVDAETETELFLKSLQILQAADRLGPSILQLPPWFSKDQLGLLGSYLRNLPREIPIAVEVRHLDFFDSGAAEDRLTELLIEVEAERIVFDSRALYSAPPSDASEQASQRRKPNLPVRPIALGKTPMVRFVGRNQISQIQPWIDEWVPVIAEWIERGKTPYVFTHCPDDTFAPEFAQRFHHAMRKAITWLPAQASWPGQKVKRQQSLF